MGKGERTREGILRQALDLASLVGLEGITIGSLAQRSGMSKSGLYAHFGSKEELQTAVLEAAGELFRDRVFRPALAEPRGLPRLRALFRNWLDWSAGTLSGGCPFVAAAAEFDDRPGPVRQALIARLAEVTEMIERAVRLAIEEGHLDPRTDPAQFAFEVWGVALAFHRAFRLTGRDEARARARQAFERLLRDAAPAAQPASAT
ncbi:MAG: TetR/AcrR family transcriptional regulator [Planctomycetota bacterium]|nr:MAG: TetR/AcrR family transcriptional regulator [Planctomycetota bacterium]